MADVGTGFLGEKIELILSLWETRSLEEIPSAKEINSLVLRNSLPIYLAHLSDALANNRRMDTASIASHEDEAIRIGRMHGADRARNGSYMITEMISEYHILRQVIFEVIERKGPVANHHRDIIMSSIESAVNDAVTKFSEVHADLQEKFINTLTHDLNNPIAAARMTAEMIIREAPDSERVTKLAKRILSNMSRVTGMIHDLLDAGRLRAGNKLALEFATCDLSQVVREVLEEMEIVNGPRFQFECKDSVNGVWSPSGLRRVVENLVGNAVKYSTPETPITVMLTKRVGAIELTVNNRGNPIAPKDVASLFEHHRRVKSVERDGIQGWGLGLTIVKGVVDAHRGTIHVLSDASDGTDFRITLPSS